MNQVLLIGHTRMVLTDYKLAVDSPVPGSHHLSLIRIEPSSPETGGVFVQIVDKPTTPSAEQ